MALAAALASCVVAATAAAGAPHELFKTDFLAPHGHTVDLAAGVTYKASVFPMPIRVTVPDGTWAGSQWKYDSSYQHMRSNKPPYYAWVTFEGHVTDFAQGAITFLIPEVGRTPSVAAMISSLRSRGHGVTLQATSPVKLGGYSGLQFGGTVVGKEHAFVPYSPASHAAGWFPDAYFLEKGKAFRIMAVNVHGRTVFALLENANMPADQFPAFLTKANALLKTLRFG